MAAARAAARRKLGAAQEKVKQQAANRDDYKRGRLCDITLVSGRLPLWIIIALVILAIAVTLKLTVGFALINSLLIYAGLVFVGHLVTLDDDFPGGWSNPDGEEDIAAASRRELAIKGLFLLAVVAFKVLILVLQAG